MAMAHGKRVLPPNYIFTCQSCRIVKVGCLLKVEKKNTATTTTASTNIFQYLCYFVFSCSLIYQFILILSIFPLCFPTFLFLSSFYWLPISVSPSPIFESSPSEYTLFLSLTRTESRILAMQKIQWNKSTCFQVIMCVQLWMFVLSFVYAVWEGRCMMS